MDQIWARDQVLNVLKRRDMAGEGPVDVMTLQQLGGIGPTDGLMAAELLVEEGLAVREDGGGSGPLWRLLGEGDAEPAAAAAPFEPEPPAAFPSDAAAAPAAVPVASGDFAGALQQLVNTIAANGGAARQVGEPRELKLTNHVVQAIDSDTLGAMVLAGVIEAAENGAEFRLVVVL